MRLPAAELRLPLDNNSREAETETTEDQHSTVCLQLMIDRLADRIAARSALSPLSLSASLCLHRYTLPAQYRQSHQALLVHCATERRESSLDVANPVPIYSTHLNTVLAVSIRFRQIDERNQTKRKETNQRQ
jgi:hypothetical protein